MKRQRIRSFLWFNSHAEEAAKFYVSLFPNSRVGAISHYGEGAPAPAGSVMTVEFFLDGVQYVALNGGPHFQLTEAFSISVDCDDQAEIDRLWAALSANGSGTCGWVKDRYGLSWQIVPTKLPEWLKDPVRAKRVMAALMTMEKLDIATLQRAHDGP